MLSADRLEGLTDMEAFDRGLPFVLFEIELFNALQSDVVGAWIPESIEPFLNVLDVEFIAQAVLENEREVAADGLCVYRPALREQFHISESELSGLTFC